MGKRLHKKYRPLRLSLERLEERTVMAASLTASLTNGVLKVEGTSGNDQIILSQSNGKISLAGVSATFNASQVQSIHIETLGGNDTVSLKGLNVGSTAYTQPTEVKNSGGNDKITSYDGKTTTLATGSLKLNQTPASTGAASNWFDSNITDTALRSLLKSDFGDSKIDRKEMIDLFKQVAKDNTISATELADLKKVVNNTELFKSVEYVGVLARDVVIGNAANQKFQGASLGNLTSNATVTQLSKLIYKWFAGADHPLAQYGNTTFAYANAAGSLFGTNGPQYSDVHQGALGDCYLVGTLGEVALRSPSDIRNMFIVNGDGTYTVRFFNKGVADYVTVDSQLPVYSGRLIFANYGAQANSTSNVLWVALAEKAYAQINESGWARSTNMGGGQNAYQAIEGGWFSVSVGQIANQSDTTSMFSSSSGNDFNTFKNAFDAGKMIGFASKSSPQNSQIAGGHQYVIVSYSATNQTITLFNPWGINNGSSKPGLVTLKWSEVAASFSYWDRTT